jgi:hypothetical protein
MDFEHPDPLAETREVKSNSRSAIPDTKRRTYVRDNWRKFANWRNSGQNYGLRIGQRSNWTGISNKVAHVLT